MIDLNNPYGLNDNILNAEQRLAQECRNCKHFSVHHIIDKYKFDYTEWTAFKVLETSKSKQHIKSRVVDAVNISKNMNIHPERCFKELISSYWSAWGWNTCTQIAINKLKCRCYNCDLEHNYLIDRILENKGNKWNYKINWKN